MSKENKGARERTLYGDHFEHPNGYKIKEIPVLKIESGPDLNADEKVKVIEYSTYQALEQRLAEVEKQLAVAVKALNYYAQNWYNKELELIALISREALKQIEEIK